MKLSNIFFTSLGLLCAAQHSQAVTRLSGSSSNSHNMVQALSTNGVCPGNNVGVYVRGTSTSSLGNQFTVKCFSGNFGASQENEVQFDVTGGSANAILFSSTGTHEPLASAGQFLPPGCAGGVPRTGVGRLSFLTNNRLINCPPTAPLIAGKSVGGFMDIEPPVYLYSGVLVSDYSSSTQPASFSQVFGVAVSADLYHDLQAAQGKTVGDSTPAGQPTISMAQLTSLTNNDDFNDAKKFGPGFLVPGTTKTTLTYCRRPETSGTQAASQIYFLEDPSASGNLNGYMLDHGPQADNAANVGVTTGAVTVIYTMNSGSSDVRNCLNTGSAVGILSTENNPIGTSDTYRFVKLSQAECCEGIAGASQAATAMTGAYNFVFESTVFNPTNNLLLELLNDWVKAGPNTPGVFRNINTSDPESKCSRGGNSAGPYTNC